MNARIKDKNYLRHLADVLNFHIDVWEGAAFYLGRAADNDSLPRLRACLSSSDVMPAITKSASIHETCMNTANHILIKGLRISGKRSEKIVCLENETQMMQLVSCQVIQ